MERDTLVADIEASLSTDDIILVLVSSEDYPGARLSVLQAVTRTGEPGIYITVNTPLSNLVETLQDEGIETGNMFFIDAITRESGAVPEQRDNAYFLRSPSNLTDLSIAVSEVISSLPPGDRFLVLDSLSTLTIYNDTDAITRFMHEMISRMREWHMDGIILTLDESTEEEVITKVTSFADTVLRV